MANENTINTASYMRQARIERSKVFWSMVSSFGSRSKRKAS